MDVPTIRIAVAALGAVAIIISAGGVFLASTGHELPASLAQVLVGSITALLGLCVVPRKEPVAPTVPVRPFTVPPEQPGHG